MTEATKWRHLTITPLHPFFAAEVRGIDLTEPLDDEVFSEVLAAFDEYSVLVWPEQALDNDSQVQFSERFGPLERMLKGSVGDGSPFAGITNVDPKTDQIFSLDDHRMKRQYSNELWHTDSSFKAISAWISLLHAREVPPSGGDTYFACMRQAWQELDPKLQLQCEQLAAEHDFVYSRSILNDDRFLTEEQKTQVPPVPQTLVNTNPRNGRKALYLGSHAARIIGWPDSVGRQLLDELTAHATQDKYVYRHSWQQHQLVMWDDRATMHRGSEWDYQRFRRIMVRTTVSGVTPTISAQAVEQARHRSDISLKLSP